MMKIRIPCALLVPIVFLCGCSSPKFTEYKGADIFTGKGGLERSVDGIDFWQNGEPDRKYKLLGFVEQKPGQRIPLGRFSKLLSDPGSDSSSDDVESAVAQVARKHNADAVIIVGGNQDASAQGELDSGRGHGGRRGKKFLVIKYME